MPLLVLDPAATNATAEIGIGLPPPGYPWICIVIDCMYIDCMYIIAYLSYNSRPYINHNIAIDHDRLYIPTYIIHIIPIKQWPFSFSC